jgi:hypothetical protein
MKHDWKRNTDPLFVPHRRCERCALIVENDGNYRIFHRGGEDVARLYRKARQPSCK